MRYRRKATSPIIFLPASQVPHRRPFLIGILSLVSTLVTAPLNPAAAASRRAGIQPWQVKAMALAQKLSAAETRPGAIAKIKMKLQTDPHHNVGQLYMYWLPVLMRQHRYTQVESLAMQGVLGDPANTEAVDRLLLIRVQALLDQHHIHRALGNAKSLFNVCTLYHTRIVLTLLQTCLERVYAHHPKILRAFISQQILGAKMPVANEPLSRCGVLAAVTVNAKAYEQRLAQLSKTNRRLIAARANLLLLADHPVKALKLFRSIAAMAGDQQQFIYAESDVCRALKAQDGTIGRANAHLLETVNGSNNFAGH